jgi:hypothetical protein
VFHLPFSGWNCSSSLGRSGGRSQNPNPNQCGEVFAPAQFDAQPSERKRDREKRRDRETERESGEKAPRRERRKKFSGSVLNEMLCSLQSRGIEKFPLFM